LRPYLIKKKKTKKTKENETEEQRELLPVRRGGILETEAG
jgi:hypothetical protein